MEPGREEEALRAASRRLGEAPEDPAFAAAVLAAAEVTRQTQGRPRRLAAGQRVAGGILGFSAGLLLLMALSLTVSARLAADDPPAPRPLMENVNPLETIFQVASAPLGGGSGD